MKYNRENTEKLLQDIFQKKILVKGVVSNMKGNYPYSKVNIKPLLIKNNFFFLNSSRIIKHTIQI